jgi:myo-inositol 2-dehydrogenase/D-chiro-inositol 1-dehydrogenase
VLAASAHTTWLFPFERVEIYGNHAMAATEEMERVTFAKGAGAAAETLDYSGLPIEDRWGYREEDRRFIGAVCGDGAPALSAEDAAATVALVDRCYRAGATDPVAQP